MNRGYGLKALGECVSCPAGNVCVEKTLEESGVMKCPKYKYCIEDTILIGGSDSDVGEKCPTGTHPTANEGEKSIASCMTCPTGNYCLTPGEPPVQCPKGSYNPIPGKNSVEDCLETEAGFYNEIPGGSTMTPCGIGRYSGRGAVSCLPCPFGHYCRTPITTDTMMESQICDLGYLCKEGTGIYPSSQVECKWGAYCLEGRILESDCDIGTYNPYTRRWLPLHCLPAPPGYYVDSMGADRVSGMCGEGYYCPVGSTSAMGIPCPDGTYRDLPGGKDVADCGLCPPGFFCPEHTVTPTICPKGMYCPSASAYPLPCPLGTFGGSKGLRYVQECTQCWKGRYCDGVGLIQPSAICDPGFHCHIASKTANPDYSSTPLDSIERTMGWVCTVGGYCQGGSSYNLYCPAGTFNIEEGIGSEDECQKCRAGDYCIGTPEAETTGKCRKGYHCPLGTGIPIICSAGTRCPEGSKEETKCLQGTYSSGLGNEECSECPAGFYCEGEENKGELGDIKPCTAGNYCPSNSYLPTPCPAGTYVMEERAQREDDCVKCKPGYYCPQGTASPSLECAPGYYCLSGAKTGTPSVEIVSNEGESLSPQYGPCPKGSYCPKGTSDPKPCPTGTYNPSFALTSEETCAQCKGGFFCPRIKLETAQNIQFACSEGYFCPQGSAQPRKENICFAGSYCPGQTSHPILCTPGTYQDGEGESLCKTCPRGSYCEEGTATSLGKQCPKGSYCPPGTHTATQYLCPVGTYNPKFNAGGISFCLDCPPGHYCPDEGVETYANKICDAGYYCSGKSSTATPSGIGGDKCSAGYYCPAGTASPILCDPGSYCSGGRGSVNGLCKDGFYCKEGARTAEPMSEEDGGSECTVGTYCPSGSSRPVPCPAGTFNEYKQKHLLSDCKKCTDGYYCSGPGAGKVSGKCEAGYYCTRTETALGHTVKNPMTHICPVGFKCPGVDEELGIGPDMIDCLEDGELGRHQIYPGQSSCQDCPSGYECTGILRIFCDNSVRKESIYCPGNQNAKESCPPGTFNMVDGSSSSTDCKLCPAGWYCPSSLDEPKLVVCLPGTYCSGGAATTEGSGDCEIGYYCPLGSSRQLPCPAGKYCDQTKMSSLTGKECSPGFWCKGLATQPNPDDGNTGEICPAGSYCPAGCIQPILCSLGTYNPHTGKSSSNDCEDCRSGYECPSPGMREPIDKEHSCPVNYYCPSKTTQGEHFPCKAGHKCPEGEAEPILCSDGMYQPLPLQGACLKCPPRTYCYNSGVDDLDEKLSRAITPKICPKGYFCEESSGDPTVESKKCPSGTFSHRNGLGSIEECSSCPPGYFCPNKGMTNVDILGDTYKCDPGHICLGRATSSNPTDGNTGRLCGVGFYCEKGDVIERPCPPGTYGESLGESTQESSCKDCPEGHYCPFRGASKNTYSDFGYYYRCNGGYICISRSTTPTPYFPKEDENTMGYYCPAGYKCPIGTGRDGEIPCNHGFWQPLPAQGECQHSPAGRVSKISLSPYSLLSHLSDCPKGFYCIEGTAYVEISKCDQRHRLLSEEIEEFHDDFDCEALRCPPGTYSERVNLESPDECYPCQPGKYCLGGNCRPDDDCDAGYVCTGEDTSPTPSETPFDFSTPLISGACPIGYYCEKGSRTPLPCPHGSYAATTKSSYCTPCDPTFYCDQIALSTAPVKLCADGYFCISGSKYEKPNDGVTGRLCQKGHYCKKGFETVCKEGTYEPRLGSPECAKCPKGYYCATGCVEPIICPKGKYCEAGSSVPIMCEMGTYSNAKGLEKASQCRICPTGYYCIDNSVKLCDPGYFCKTRASSATDSTLLCPKGHYCPNSNGIVIPVLCPLGKFTINEGGKAESDCDICQAGYYCIEGLTVPYECPKGYYCIAEQKIGTECPIGTYLNHTRGEKLEDCKSCTPGHYCNEWGIGDEEFYSCLPGKYCLGNDNTGVPIAPKDCSEGTYRNRPGAASISECYPCPGGRKCGIGTTTPTACLEGFYCPVGSHEGTLCTSGHYCSFGATNPTICPPAYYCPEGAAYPTKCPNGFYCPQETIDPIICPQGSMGTNNILNVDLKSGCASCYAGFYSDQYYLTMDKAKVTQTNTSAIYIEDTAPKCKICTAGYVCLGSTTKEFPTDIYIDKGYECPRGHYCPSGSYSSKRCPRGTFNKFKKMKSLEDCNKCDINTYSNQEARKGCLPCSKSSKSGLGAETCKCIGNNRVFLGERGACLCAPNYKPVRGGELEDSKEGCVPILYTDCGAGEIRGSQGECVAVDDCSAFCRGGGGRRRAGSSICICDQHRDVDEICDQSCRAAAPVVVLLENGNLVVSASTFEESMNVILSRESSLVGKPRYLPGASHNVRSLSFITEGGPSATYQPIKSITSTIRRNLGGNHRYLQTTTGSTSIDSPIICLNLGDSTMFEISTYHYPVYLKNHLANTNPNFNYGQFSQLTSLLKTPEYASTNVFIYTFEQSGTFVFGGNNNTELITIIKVVEETAKCADEDKYIQPISYDSLLKNGFTMRNNINKEPNTIGIIIIFLIIFILIPLFLWLIYYLHNKHIERDTLGEILYLTNAKKKQKRQVVYENIQKDINPDGLQSHPIIIKEEYSEEDFCETPGGHVRDNKQIVRVQIENDPNDEQIDPKVFSEIYNELEDHTDYVKGEFMAKANKDEKNLTNLYSVMHELREEMRKDLKSMATIVGHKESKELFKRRKEDIEEEDEFIDKKENIKEINSNHSKEEELGEKSAVEIAPPEYVEGGHIIDDVMAEDEEKFNVFIEGNTQNKKDFLSEYNKEQAKEFDQFKKKVMDMSNLSFSEKNDLLKEFDKQMLAVNKMLLLEEEKQEADLMGKIDERKARRNHLKEKLLNLDMKQSDTKSHHIRETNIIAEKRLKEETEIENEYKKNLNNGIEEINKAKKKKLEKAQRSFQTKIAMMKNQDEIRNLMNTYQADMANITENLDAKNQKQIADLMKKLEERKQHRLAKTRENFKEKMDELNADKKVKLAIIQEETGKLTKHLLDEEMDKNLEKIVSEDADNMIKENSAQEKLERERKEGAEKWKNEKEDRLHKLKLEEALETQKLNSGIEQEKMEFEEKIKNDIVESRAKREVLKAKWKAATSQKDKDKLQEQITNFERLIKDQLNAERDKQTSSIQDRLKARKKNKKKHIEELNNEFEAKATEKENDIVERGKILKEKIRNERLIRLIESAVKTFSHEELPFAIDKIIEEQHIKDIVNLTQQQFKFKAKILKDAVMTLLQQKLDALDQLKEGFDEQYQYLKLQLDRKELTPPGYDRKLVDLTGKENDRLRDLELEYVQKQNIMEENMIRTTEKKHCEELIKVKEDQFSEKKRLLHEYVGDELLEGALAGETVWMEQEMEKYQAHMRNENKKQLEEIENRKKLMDSISMANDIKITELNYQTRRLMEDQEEREKIRNDKQKKDMEKMKVMQEAELRQQGISAKQKSILMEQHLNSLNELTEILNAERLRQATMLKRKLEDKLKQGQILKHEKDQQLALYKKHKSTKLDMRLKNMQENADQQQLEYLKEMDQFTM